MSNPSTQQNTLYGKIIYRTKGFYYVMDSDGTVHECRLKRGLFVKSNEKPDPVTGDCVYCVKGAVHSAPQIYKIEERKTVLRRKKPTRNEWLTIAANIDILLIITPFCQPKYNYLLAVQLITAANACKIQPVIVLTKFDLMEPSAINEIQDIFGELGLPVFKTGLNQMAEVSKLKVFLKDTVCALSGVSGAGKSSLINMMFNASHIKTGEVNARLHGKHTTTMTRMHEPEPGYSIIDSPGIRNFEFYEIDKHTLREYVPIIQNYKGQCKMRNCFHASEKICAVKDAVADSKISRRLYDCYLKILTELNQ